MLSKKKRLVGRSFALVQLLPLLLNPPLLRICLETNQRRTIEETRLVKAQMRGADLITSYFFLCYDCSSFYCVMNNFSCLLALVPGLYKRLLLCR